MSKNGPKLSPLQAARADLIERVSVAGWKEALDEPILWIRRVYQISLVVLSCFCVFLVIVGFVEWRKSGYKDEITDLVDIERLPFTNVTICAQLSLNRTFIKHNISLPDDLVKHFEQEPDEELEKFYDALVSFLTITSRPRKFSPTHLAQFSKIFRSNPQFNDHAAFVESATMPCDRMLQRCWFGGKEYRCCDYATRGFHDDGVCYLLAVSKPSLESYEMTKF